MTDKTLLLDVKNVHLCLQGRTILQDISLRLQQNHIVTLIGLNGSGKSTLLRVILGLLTPDQGSVWCRPGSRIGYMPQRLTIEPTLPLTVQRFMQLGARFSFRSTQQDQAQIVAALAETGVDALLKAPLQTLSGGELQRVMLARALVRKPDLLILDEPVQAVDVAGQYALYDLIADIRQRRQCGILIVSHDLHLVLPASDQVICMNHHICCAGTPEQVADHPAFQQLFGREQADHLAGSLTLYRHNHNHTH